MVNFTTSDSSLDDNDIKHTISTAVFPSPHCYLITRDLKRRVVGAVAASAPAAVRAALSRRHGLVFHGGRGTRLLRRQRRRQRGLLLLQLQPLRDGTVVEPRRRRRHGRESRRRVSKFVGRRVARGRGRGRRGEHSGGGRRRVERVVVLLHRRRPGAGRGVGSGGRRRIGEPLVTDGGRGGVSVGRCRRCGMDARGRDDS